MSGVLMSIKPEFTKFIFNGMKKFEYRKRGFKKNVDFVKVYSTKPDGVIIGEFKVGRIISGTPDYVWELTKEDGGVEKLQFDGYFKNSDIAYAIEILEPKLYDTPLMIDYTPPQSFKYI